MFDTTAAVLPEQGAPVEPWSDDDGGRFSADFLGRPSGFAAVELDGHTQT